MQEKSEPGFSATRIILTSLEKINVQSGCNLMPCFDLQSQLEVRNART